MKKTLGLAASALAVLLGSQAAQAGADVGSTYVAPLLTGSWLDDSRKADDDSGFAFAVGKAVAEKWNVEALVTSASHGIGAGQKLKLQGFELAAQRLFYRAERVSPYLTIGLGRLEDRRPNSKDADFYVKYGAGILGDLKKNTKTGTNLQLRAELAGRRLDSRAGSGDPVDYVAMLGLQYNWGGAIEQPPPPPPEPTVARDLPPPPPEPVDGDDDGDGVPNSKDKCPGTPPDTKVDANGCECGDIVLRGVTFVTGLAEITPQAQQLLDTVSVGLAKRTGAKIEIRGHTDDVGSENANMALSQLRAEAVKAYMASKGLDASNLTTIGLGEMRHIAGNDTPDGREQNRRVTLQILSVVCDERAEEDLVLRGVTFATGTNKITPTSRLVLDSAVQYVKARPMAATQVRGHTDDVGGDEANMRLSEARANAVRDYLIEGGIDASRVEAVGLGETDPIVANDSPAARSQNRRVTLRIKP